MYLTTIITRYNKKTSMRYRGTQPNRIIVMLNDEWIYQSVAFSVATLISSLISCAIIS